MNSHKLLAALAGACLFSVAAQTTWAAYDPVNEPLPMVGTGAHGHAYPGAAAPFGMVQLSPDTPEEGWDGCSGYHYSQTIIWGFSHTHLSGTGCRCLGDVLLMPAVGEVKLEHGTPGNGYASSFSHEQERATPGSYSVFLKDPKVQVDLTATERCGFHKYTFPATDQAHIILDLVHGVGSSPVGFSEIHIENDHTISGWRTSEGWGGERTAYFVIEFSKPFASFDFYSPDGTRMPANATSARARRIKAFVSYKTAQDEAILVKVAISATGLDGARKNLAAEIPGWDFAVTKAGTVKKWSDIFKSFAVESFDPQIVNTFYGNVYLSCLAPTLFNDVDGSYFGMDHKVHTAADFQNYSTFSLWDIYRAEWPMIVLLQPQRVDDMVNSLIAGYRELGQHSTPIWPLWGNETWCMIGYHSVVLMADAYLKGFRGFDANEAWLAMRDTAMQDRNGLDTYRRLGFCASRKGGERTSRTLEYSFDDWAIARMAEALGHKEDAEMFFNRSANYRNTFDSTVGFFRGRKADGTWRYPFVTNALVGDEYTEACAWQYAFAAQQDIPGMIELYGGDQGFINKLDALFEADSYIQTGIPDISGLIGQYSQGDEQCHHVAYLYAYAGAPFKTQQRVRQIMATLFDDTPEGQCGNVDCGQMGAWYVMSAMGFYPVNPASSIYIIGSPVVTQATLRFNEKFYGGKVFSVTALNNSKENIFIQSAKLNGQPLNRAWLTHQEIISGGKLELVMGPQPNTQWGATERPPSTMPAGFKYAPLPPPADPNPKPQELKLPIRIVCGTDEAVGKFLPDYDLTMASENHTGDRVNTDVPHAAPEEVYRYERYGRDFSYKIPVPPGQYLVRLHFAEIFNAGVGNRRENISINGKRVLENFDIQAAAGGVNKAVVKEFPGIEPDASGNIVIRIRAVADSPDQNAKISGIEILAGDGTAGLYKFKTDDGKTEITINTEDAPELKDWAEHKLAPALAEWYPKITAMLASDGYTAPTAWPVVIKPMDGVAYTSGKGVTANSKWLEQEINREAVGSIVHEAVHVAQQYHGRVPGWLTEGIADYIRWFKYEPQSHGADMVWAKRQRNFNPKYDAAYRTSANFLNWVSEKYDPNLVTKLNVALREGTYNEDLWKTLTGKPLLELADAWSADVKAQLAN